MQYIDASSMRKEYRVVHVDGKNQLHHIACDRQSTLVIEWPENFPGGFSLDSLHDSMENHAHVAHKTYID